MDFLLVNRSEFYWGYSNPPDDFAGFRLRYHNEPGVITWDDAIQPHQGLLTHTSYYTSLVPVSARVIMVKAVDLVGIESINAATIFRESPAVITANVVAETDYDPVFGGTKINSTVTGSPGELVADNTGGTMYTGVPTAPMYIGGSPSPDMYTSSYLEMSYQDSFVVTTPGDFIVRLTTTGQGYNIQMKLSTDLIWAPVPDRVYLTAGTYDLKYTGYGGHTPVVLSKLAAIIDVPDISEHHESVSISNTGTRVPPVNTYSAITIVGVTIQDDGVNFPIGYRIFDKDPVLGPLIKLYDAAGSLTAGLVDVDIKGY